MVYRALGVLFSHSGFFISYCEFHENAGAWTFEVKESGSHPSGAISPLIQKFIEDNNLKYHVALITIHSEIPDFAVKGASIAAATGLPVISDLPALDIELGGNGQFYKTASQRLSIEKNDLNELNKSVCASFMGILRWREEYNFLSSVTGASRNSIGGAVWMGQEA